MSFLNGIGAAGAAGEPSRLSQIAGRIGTGMNGIASAGGATPGYSAPAAPDNHMQLLDSDVIQQLVQQFGGRPQAPQMTGYAR